MPVSAIGAIASSPMIGQTPPASAPVFGQNDFSRTAAPAARPSSDQEQQTSGKREKADFMRAMMVGSAGGCQGGANRVDFAGPWRLSRSGRFPAKKPASR